MKFRLSLDVPYDFATEPGFRRSVHCADFREEPGALNNTFLCPVTGTLMLKPTFFGRDWFNYANPLSAFRTVSGEMKAIKRRGMSSSAADGFTNIRPSSGSFSDLVVGVAKMLVDASGEADTLKWVAETNQLLPGDQPFAVSLHVSHDEMPRYNNWLGISWDNIWLHFSARGQVKVFRCLDRTNAADSSTWVLHDEFFLADLQTVSNATIWFHFIPIPPLGLVIYTSLTGPSGLMSVSSSRATTFKGRLVRWPELIDGDGHSRLFGSSAVRLAINRSCGYSFVFMPGKFPSTGTYLDGVYDPGYHPTASPGVQVGTYNTGKGSATGVVRTDTDSADWAASQRKSRVKVSLATDDDRYTPFVYGINVDHVPVFATRDTTPVVLNTSQDKVLRLEFTDTHDGQWEGKADVVLGSSAARAIVERGDSTFLLEESVNGTTWSTVNGGIAKGFRVSEINDDGLGVSYECEVDLYDMREMLREKNQISSTAFDGMTVGDALNVCNQCSGLPAFPSIPALLNSKSLPTPTGTSGWSLGPKFGDKIDEVVNKLLLLGMRQWTEWYWKYDWALQKPTLVQRLRDTSEGATWELVTSSDLEDTANRKLALLPRPGLQAMPPENNIIWVDTQETVDTKARGLNAVLINRKSITDKTDAEYLGRARTGRFISPDLQTQAEVNKMCRRIFDRGAHRSMQGMVRCRMYVSGLVPNVRVRVKSKGGTTLFGGELWVKERHVVTDMDDKHVTEYRLDSVWEGDLK